MAAASRSAFRQNGLKATAARFASTDAILHGKIHQVIGAVVDGTLKLCREDEVELRKHQWIENNGASGVNDGC